MLQYTSGKQKIETPQKMMKEEKKKSRRCRQDLTENRIQQEVNNIKFGIKKTLNEMITELNSFFFLFFFWFLWFTCWNIQKRQPEPNDLLFLGFFCYIRINFVFQRFCDRFLNSINHSWYDYVGRRPMDMLATHSLNCFISQIKWDGDERERQRSDHEFIFVLWLMFYRFKWQFFLLLSKLLRSSGCGWRADRRLGLQLV